jgi:hypothetical protein
VTGQIIGQRDVDQRGRPYLVQDVTHEGGVEAAPEVGDILARERADDPLNLTLGQPDSEAVDDGDVAALAERG